MIENDCWDITIYFLEVWLSLLWHSVRHTSSLFKEKLIPGNGNISTIILNIMHREMRFLENKFLVSPRVSFVLGFLKALFKFVNGLYTTPSSRISPWGFAYFDDASLWILEDDIL